MSAVWTEKQEGMWTKHFVNLPIIHLRPSASKQNKKIQKTYVTHTCATLTEMNAKANMLLGKTMF